MKRASLLKYSSILVFLTGMLFSCSNDIEEVKSLDTEQEEGLVTTYTDVQLSYTDSAILQSKVQAGRLKQFSGKDERSEFDNGVVMKFYEDGIVQTILKANKVIKRDKSKAMEAFGNVILTNINGEELSTEHLIYNEEDEEISTQEMVKITRDEEILWGEGMVSNATFTQYNIKKVKSQIPMKDE